MAISTTRASAARETNTENTSNVPTPHCTPCTFAASGAGPAPLAVTDAASPAAPSPAPATHSPAPTFPAPIFPAASPAASAASAGAAAGTHTLEDACPEHLRQGLADISPATSQGAT